MDDKPLPGLSPEFTQTNSIYIYIRQTFIYSRYFFWDYFVKYIFSVVGFDKQYEFSTFVNVKPIRPFIGLYQCNIMLNAFSKADIWQITTISSKPDYSIQGDD